MLTNGNGTDDATGQLVYSSCGPVVIRAGAAGFMGAEVTSNNTAELSGIGHALLYLLENCPAVPSVVIRYDSEYAANSVLGVFNGEKNKQMIAHIRGLLARVRTQQRVFFSKVKGHSGHEWNELVDRLAKEGAAKSTGSKSGK